MFSFGEILGLVMIFIGAAITLITGYFHFYRFSFNSPITLFTLYGIGFIVLFTGFAIAMFAAAFPLCY